MYRNPLVFADGTTPTNPDPFILRWCGRYYCYSTHVDGVLVSRSDDLVTWEALGFVYQLDGGKNYWAPSVLYHDGTFYLYYSCELGDGGDHAQWMQVATSDTPEGPFTYVKTFFEKFTIDTHPVRDRVTGDFYMYYCVNGVTSLDADNVGTSIVVDRMTSLTELAGRPVPVIVPTMPQEIFEKNRFGDGRDWHTIEGAANIEHHDHAYLTYSANAYVGEDYHVGYVQAPYDKPVGDLDWHKYPSDFDWGPLVRRSDTVEGTGHNTLTKAPNMVDDWIVYHGRNLSEPIIEGMEQRTMRIDPIFFDGVALRTPAPTAVDQTAPARPTREARLTDDSGPEGWETTDGGYVRVATSWTTDPGSARTLTVGDALFDTYSAELWSSAAVTHMGARFGIVVAHADVENYTEIVFDEGTRTLMARQFTQHVGRVLATADLGSINLEVAHLLRVERTFGDIDVFLDGVRQFTVSVGEAPARVGTVSYRTAARFAYLGVTDHLNLYGKRLAQAGRVLRCSRPLIVGEYGVGTPLRREVRLSAARQCVGCTYAYEFERFGADATVAFRPVQASPDSYVEVVVDEQGLVLRTVSAGETTAELRAAAPARRFSVRTHVAAGRCVITVGGQTYDVALPAANDFAQECTLFGSTIRSLERISIHH